MSGDLGFSYQQRGDEYHIYRNGLRAAVLRGNKAVQFADKIAN